MKNYPSYIVMQKKLQDQGMPISAYCLLNQEGKLIREILDVLDIVQEYDIVLGTGHITHAETFALAREAARRNFKKLLITHADWNFTHYSLEEQRELVRLGATIEHSYTSPAEGAVAWEDVFREIREIGPEHVVLTTDLGQGKNEYPDQGLQKYAEKVLENGFTRAALHQMIVENPTSLVER